MKIKTKSHAKVIILLFIALLMFNCQNDENLPDQLQNKIETVSIDEAKNFLMHSRSNSSAKSTNNEFENLEFNKIAQEKIKGTDQLLTVIPFTTNNDLENNRILMLKIDNEIKSVIFSMYPDENSSKESFSGTLFSYSLDGNFISGFRAKNGIIVGQFFENTSTLKTNIEKGKIPTLTRKTPSSSSDGVVVQNNYRNTVHALDMFGYSSIFGNDIFGGGFNDYGGVDYYSWDAGDGGITSPTVVEIINQLTGKAKCIYESLRSSSSGFENAIKKFDGDFTVSHLKLTINNNLSTNVYGQTQLPVNFITEIQISNTALNSLSDLGKATVFAHEIIHAEIYRKMLSAAQVGTLLPDGSNMTPQQQVNYINSMKDNFPGLYDYYYKRYKPTWNHEMMANHYRSTIANVIQQFDNNRLPRSTYEAVSWVGLGKLDNNITSIAWDNLSIEEKNKITNLINENFYNGPSNCN
ncbi:hypothetical protein FLA105534_04924 [Flavobacterium bizetiae]|uniref:Uncharacterized protein n=1 Tax=Flavobacterium bizetiae TaxID=2704140 RepID=A0A6J4GXV9_9FLAO|nr:hypothetical protein [Flavobacterium bizetiae]CAA9203742.1 hypothetical protein FLA105534_04924 [Flavobacterium bizetiae]CAD5343334.1 hypothetical protein FLA105535_03332 [Flavobacterium bizetiae]CAD5349327.1 hypothetical protein FLA105534_03311 [Flavobacterium bizetiae]